MVLATNVNRTAHSIDVDRNTTLMGASVVQQTHVVQPAYAASGGDVYQRSV
jgi:hypothetical protein